MKAHDETRRLLGQAGATLVRSTGHEAWKLTDGCKVTLSRTPGDWRAEMNSLANVRRMLGVGREKKAAKPKPEKARPEPQKVAARAKRTMFRGEIFTSPEMCSMKRALSEALEHATT